jgi:hypothetical protein
VAAYRFLIGMINLIYWHNAGLTGRILGYTGIISGNHITVLATYWDTLVSYIHIW